MTKQTTKEFAFNGKFSNVISARSEHSQYGLGFNSTLSDAELMSGDYLKIIFAALKKHKVKYNSKSARLVVSLERNKQQLFWDGVAVDSRIIQDGKQATGQWCKVVIWKKIPEGVQPSDFLKVYTWNTQIVPIFIDDLKIELWREKKPED